MEQGILETWTARKAADETRHSAACIVCREHLRPANDQKLYAVKNARTREFVHVLVNGESLESKLGWSRDEILYSMLIEDGVPKGPPMTDEVKARLREAGEKRKAEDKLKRLVRANTPARPAEGEQEETMTRKSKKKKNGSKADAIRKLREKRSHTGSLRSKADAFLPARFTRKHGGEDHVFERAGDGWKLDGKGPMPLRRAMAELMGEANARATSFVRYFRTDRIAAA